MMVNCVLGSRLFEKCVLFGMDLEKIMNWFDVYFVWWELIGFIDWCLLIFLLKI